MHTLFDKVLRHKDLEQTCMDQLSDSLTAQVGLSRNQTCVVLTVINCLKTAYYAI